MTNGANNSRSRQMPDGPQSKVLSRAYREAVERLSAGPTRSVDDAIRAAAHRAVEKSSRRIEAAEIHRLFRRLRTPLVLAVTVLLAVAIGFRVYRTGEMQTASSPTMQQSEIDKQPEGKDLAESRQSSIDKKQRADKPGETHPSLAPLIRDRSVANQEFAEDAVGRNALRSPSGATDNPARPRSSEGGTPQPPQLGTEDERQKAEGAVRPFPTAPGPAPAPPSDRKEAALPLAQPPAERTASTLSMSRSRLQDRKERTQQEKARDVPATEVQLLAQRLEGRPPEVWVEEIRILKRGGRGSEARELLDALRKKFPDFALPEDLR